MEILERVKAILFNPKEEWTIIEAENEPHANVFTKYLLIMALIPTIAYFAGEYLENRSMYKEYIEEGTERIEKSFGNSSNYYDNAERKAEREMAKNKAIVEFEEKSKEVFQIANPFGTTKWSIIFALCLFGIFVGGVYISTAIINALTKQFGSEKDFNRIFSLVAYSYTPLCVAGILYVFHSFASLIPYIGLYGLFLVYQGIESQLKPATDKKNTCLFIVAVTVVGVWMLLARVAVPEIQLRVMTEEKISIMKQNYKGEDIFKIDAKMRKTIEKQIKSELENHKY